MFGMDMGRIIVHVDMDAFFASIEQLDYPEYRGRPVVVGADPRDGKGRGVVCAASYEARKFGIHSALPISIAYRRCPSAVFTRPRFRRYNELSGYIMNLLGEFSPVIEQISIDEAFLDATGTERLFGPPEELGKRIKMRIFQATGLTASVGIASNKSIAKIASDLQKPDGLTICPDGHEKEFIAPLPVSVLWGAGKKTVQALQQAGMHTVGDIARLTADDMEKLYGKWGTHLWMLANGIDDRPVNTEWERKSCSEETTFDEDVAESRIVEQTLFEIADRLSRRIRREGVLGRTITLKIRIEGFKTYTRSHSLPAPLDDMQSIRSAAVNMFRKFDREGKKVRLVGIAVSNLEAAESAPLHQLELFNTTDPVEEISPPPGKNPEKLLDELKNRFGEKVTRAALLETTDPRK